MGRNQVQDLIDIWWQAAVDNVALLRSLEPSDWEKPTDLPGWNVRAIAAHLAHLESDLAGNPQQPVDVPDAPHIHGPMGRFTESGLVARASRTADELIDELEQSVTVRRAALDAMQPLDPAAPADGFAAMAGWTWATLLSNRPLDHWMHEQDVRRAVGRPGGLDSPAARHVVGVFTTSLGYVLSKKVGAPVGSTMTLHLTRPLEETIAVGVGDDGRGALLAQEPSDPTVRLTMDVEGFIVLAGGRRAPGRVDVVIDGDQDLGRTMLDNLGVTP